MAERVIRTISERVRCMLVNGGLPEELWAEAVLRAVYCINLVPSRGIGMQIPYQLWKGVQPPLKHLKVFGCLAYAYVDADERRKGQACAHKMIFFGYPSDRRGYRLLNAETLEVVHSHSVVFYEKEFINVPTVVEAIENRARRRNEKINFEENQKSKKIISLDTDINQESVSRLYDYVLPQTNVEENRQHTSTNDPTHEEFGTGGANLPHKRFRHEIMSRSRKESVFSGTLNRNNVNKASKSCYQCQAVLVNLLLLLQMR